MGDDEVCGLGSGSFSPPPLLCQSCVLDYRAMETLIGVVLLLLAIGTSGIEWCMKRVRYCDGLDCWAVGGEWYDGRGGKGKRELRR